MAFSFNYEPINMLRRVVKNNMIPTETELETNSEIARLSRELYDARIAERHALKQAIEYREATQVELNKRATQIRVLQQALRRHNGCSRWTANDAALSE